MSLSDQNRALIERAIVNAIALFDVAIMGTEFTKPQAGRLVLQKERAERALADLRQALAPLNAAKIEAERAAGGVSWLRYTENQVVAWLDDRSKRYGGPDNRYARARDVLDAARAEGAPTAEVKGDAFVERITTMLGDSLRGRTHDVWDRAHSAGLRTALATYHDCRSDPTPAQGVGTQGQGGPIASPSHSDLMVSPESIGPWLEQTEAAKVICDFMNWPEDGPAWDDANKLAGLLRPPVATPRTQGQGDGWRPEVRAFAGLMEAQLRANDHKGGWKNCKPEWLYRRLLEETNEVFAEIWQARSIEQPRSPDASLTGRECADVANFAMMIADVCGALPATPREAG